MIAKPAEREALNNLWRSRDTSEHYSSFLGKREMDLRNYRARRSCSPLALLASRWRKY